jgi:membrane-associated phospholipid phosphatase
MLKIMMNSDNCLKLCWANIFVFGLCFMGSPALADVIPKMTADNEGSLNRQNPFSFKESQSEAPRSDYLFSLSDDFTFDGTDDEPLFATNKTYSSALKARSESTSLRGKIKLDSNYFKGIFSGARYALTSPLRWDKADWTTASIVAGVTGVFFVLDDDVNEEVKSSRSTTTDSIADVFEPFGNAAFTLPAMMGFYIYGNFWENEKVERTALLAVESFLVTSLFTGVIKVVMGRTRPFDGAPADEFKGPSTGNNAFPSGHTSTAFAVATIVANEYEHIPLITPLSYGIATMTGFSRLNDNKHWASDIVFGAALGYFTSKTILKLHSNKKGRHFTIYPRVDRRGGGLILSTRF